MADLATVDNAKGMDTFKIKMLPTIGKYKTDSAMVTKMNVTDYRIFTYKGNAFTSSDEAFIEAVKTENLHEVDFELEYATSGTAEQKKKPLYSITGFVTQSQFVKFSKTQFQVQLMDVKNFVANPELATKMNDIDKILMASS